MAVEVGWLLEVRPRKMRIVAYTLAAIVAVGSIVGGATAALVSSGPRMTVADQISIAGVGLMVATVILLLTRPRLRAGDSGITLRNILLERHLPWNGVNGVSFPEQSPWARLELPGDEYLPIMALQAWDGEVSALSLERFRELGTRFSREVSSESGI